MEPQNFESQELSVQTKDPLDQDHDKEDPTNWKRNTVIFLASQTMTLLGSMTVSFAIIWYITLETSSGFLMTLSIVCSFLPQILISLFAGVWADRYDRKKLIIYSDIFIAVPTLFLAFLFLSGITSIWLIFVISIVRSIGSGVQSPAVGAILPQIVPADKLMKVNGINSSIGSAMMLVSPALSGILLSVFGLSATLFLDFATAALAVIILSFLPVAARIRSIEETDSNVMKELKDGIAYARSHTLIKYLLVFYALFFFLITPAAFLTPLLVERSFGSDVWRLTANEISWSLGSLIGGVIVAITGGFKNRIYTMGFSCMVFGVLFAFLGIAGNFAIYLGIMLIAGIFMPFFGTAETVLIQEKVPEHMLGRIFSIIQIIASTVLPLGMVLFGPLADVVSIEAIMIVTGILMAILGIYIFTNKKLIELNNYEHRIL
jgi:DHA3 family macrolide efflux protein-like MFS transporter